jgi:hypothetical protein
VRGAALCFTELEPPMSAIRSPGEAAWPLREGTSMLLKIIGAIVVIWLAFAVLGFVFKAVLTLVIVGAVVALVGGAGYALVKGAANRKQIR